MQQSRIFVGMVLILIFAEVLGLYGSVSPQLYELPDYRKLCLAAADPASLIIALILNTNASG